MSKDFFGLGCIGVGGRGSIAHFAHKPEEGFRVVAGADPREDRLEGFREKFDNDVFTTTDYREMLARPEVDAVFVFSPDYLHQEHALASLQADKPTFVEKPLTITIEGCDLLLKTAMERRVRLYVGHNMRHMIFTQKMKELIDQGVIGEVRAAWCRHFISYGGDAYYKDWHSEIEKANGLLLQKGAHDLDILHYLCGGYTTRTVGMGSLSVYDRITDRLPEGVLGDPTFRPEHWPPLTQKQLSAKIEVEDHSMMLMNLDNGVMCSYMQCHYTPDAWRNYTVIGTEGRIENFGDYGHQAEIVVYNKRAHYNADGDERVNATPSGPGHGGGDPAILGEFIRFARDGGPIKVSPVAARNSVAAGCAATHSLRNGNIPVDVPPLDPELVAYFESQP